MSKKKEPTVIKVVTMNEMTLLPPRKDLCQECSVKHDPTLPHNKDSLYYQFKFNKEHDRAPTWDDAMAHCTEEVKETWRVALANTLQEIENKKGVKPSE